MSLTVIVVSLALTLFFVYVLRVRLTAASTMGNVAGFLLNPLLYLVVYGFLYLVLGTWLSRPGMDHFLFRFSEDASIAADALCLFAFFVMLCFYARSVDYSIQFLALDIGVLRQISIILLVLSSVAAWAALAVYGPGLLALQFSRGAAAEYYMANFLGRAYFGQLCNVTYIACILIFFIGRMRRPAISWFLFLMLPYLIADYMQNGRAVIVACLTTVMLFYFIAKERVYLVFGFAAFVGLAFMGIYFRTDYGVYALKDNFMNATTEFYLTRHALDAMIESGAHSGAFGAVNLALSQIMPGFIKSALGIYGERYTDYVQGYLGLSFGLSGNILAEAFYYGGYPLAVFVPFLISVVYYQLNRAQWIGTVPGVIFLLVVITSTQYMMRVGFFEVFSRNIGAMLLYFYLFVLAGRAFVFRKSCESGVGWQ